VEAVLSVAEQGEEALRRDRGTAQGLDKKGQHKEIDPMKP
jgi:hypothetical protein